MDEMPVEVVEKVIGAMSVMDMVVYGGSSKSNHAIMHGAVPR